MKPTLDDSRAPLRSAVYWLLIVTATFAMAGRIMKTADRHGRTPFHSSNDRSRWCTIHALVDHGTYEIDQVVLENPDANYPDQAWNPRWKTIDLVRHQGRDGREHYYSSKPPLLPTMLAGKYWLIQRAAGISFDEETQAFYIVRAILLATNVLPLLLYFVLLSRLVERYGQTDWGRVFVMAIATWGTFLTTFAVTLNNHLPAAISVLLALYPALAIWRDDERRLRYFVVAGLFSAFAVANELPALSFLVAVGAGLMWKAPWRTLAAFVPAVAVVAGAFFFTNYLGHESLRPPYAHRSEGTEITTTDHPFDDDGRITDALQEKLAAANIPISVSPWITEIPDLNRWMVWDEENQQRLEIVGLGNTYSIRRPGNWYHYERSYWISSLRNGVDLGEKSRAVYAFHMLLGHHGIFSLTPVWLMAVVGIGILIASKDRKLRCFALMVAGLSLVCIAFYIARPMLDRNYGGMSCGLRWLFWFTPLWLLCVLPVADWMASSRFWRGVGIGLLGISIFSASYAPLNPWTHPWIFDYWQYLGLIRY